MYYKTPFLLYISIIFCYSSCGHAQNGKNENIKEAHQYTNELSKESSPYLLQHAHNPVNWLPWGEKALKKAKDENKMIIISIGYAACHWCHVMEHESFEDTAVARLMNENFIAIKVDREERPDVDQVYMTAAQLITGNGGWPLNALALPDGRPFYAGTYYPKNEWVKMLTYFISAWEKDNQPLIKQAEEITKGIHSSENITFTKEEKKPTLSDLDQQFISMKRNIDIVKGGMSRAPKFPMPAKWEYLLRYNYISKNDEALKAVEVTLDKMAFGGIYDQLGGGFARYSTDADWHVPHFEKMLYDNAQLVSLYAHAFQKTKNPLYKKVVYETLEFVRHELTSPEGGFYSSLDADSNGEEGKYYVWTKEEIEKLLGAEAPVFMSYYNITKAGNWEKGNNILLRKESDESIAQKNGITVATLNKKIEEATKKLLKIRAARIKPALDDKVLSSWNALMLNGYVQAYRAFGDDSFLNAAIANANFLMKNAIATDGEMNRIYKNGKSTINGMLDDYAFTISAFIELYQATFEEKWLHIANKISNYVQKHFFDPASRMFFYTHNEHSNLISRKMEISDNVIPASNSEMAKNLLILGHYFYNTAYVNMAKQMLTNVVSDLQANITFYSNWGILETMLVNPFYEVAVLGNDFKNKRQEFDQYYLPNMLLMGGKEEGKLELLESKLVEGQTTIYVCKEKVCKQPVTEVVKALAQIEK